MDSNFQKMKRSELQMHAKNAGIRANMKTTDLIKALSAHISKLADNNKSRRQEIPPSSSEVAIASGDIQDTKRGRRGHGCQDSENEIVQKEMETVVDDSASSGNEKLVKEDIKETKPKRSVKPRRRRRNTTKGSITPETPKSVQKRAFTDCDNEAELPPAKRRNTQQAAVSTSSSEVAQTYRRSSRKKTFSLSPPKVTTSEKDDQHEESQIREKVKSVKDKTPTDTGRGRTSRSTKQENSKTEVTNGDSKTDMKIASPAPQKPAAVKVQAKKTGIPLPKIHATVKLTPGKSLNFKKVHKSQFDKLESIDDYLDRKRKRIEALTNSYKKKARVAPSSDKKVPKKRMSAVTPGITKDAKPVAQTRQSFLSPKPKVKTVSANKTVTFQTSKLKTPARAPTIAAKMTENRAATPAALNMNFTGRKSGSGATPFKFGTDTPSKQSKFNLKASLQKPLTYKPYTGKVKPMAEIQPQAKKPVSSRVQRAKENLKKPKLSSRQDRQRATSRKQALNRKDNAMSRRGLHVA